MKLLAGWSRVTFLGVLVLSLGLVLTLERSGNAQARKVLRVGLAEDPDILDPTLARTFVGRIVFASLCDKLYDIDPNLNIVPQLATSLPQLADDGKTLTITLRQGVKFHDGTDFNAGVQPPTPSWGSMLNVAQGFLSQAPWMAWWPGLAIVVTVLAFNVVGDGLHDALDPKQY